MTVRTLSGPRPKCSRWSFVIAFEIACAVCLSRPGSLTIRGSLLRRLRRRADSGPASSRPASHPPLRPARPCTETGIRLQRPDEATIRFPLGLRDAFGGRADFARENEHFDRDVGVEADL